MSWHEYPRYSQPTLEELQSRIEQSRKDALKKNKKYDPILPVSGNKLTHTWWGNAWCENMTSYLDYDNRLARGKRYAKAGSIIDLKITQGKVTAKVQGSRSRPYSVTITIDPLSSKQVDQLVEQAGRRASSLEELVNGQFPQDLKDAFLKKGGLFPTRSQIHFDCSCPDWAIMCKHVAAVMYGIGMRLDENPLYFFELRGIDTNSMVRRNVKNKVEAMLENASKPSKRILPEEDIDELFCL